MLPRFLSGALTLIASAQIALAQRPVPTPARPATSAAVADPAPGSELTISLVTMGTGEHVWEMFGHNAIWVHDRARGTDEIWNWGMFDFSQPLFIPHFLQGRMLYTMGAESLDGMLRQYQAWNRSVTSQELNLTPAERLQIKRFIDWNAQPGNTDYRYDYFRDNCSTRVRDILDRALGGQIRAAATSRMTQTTYRSHALRLMQSDRPLVVGVDIGLGRPSDHQLNAWEEMFLPQKLHDFLRDMQVTDSTGKSRPLVLSEQLLVPTTRAPEPTQPPNLVLWLLPCGLIIAGAIVWSATRAVDARHVERRPGRVAVLVPTTYALVAGLLGLLLTLLWSVTDHVFAHQNENLLLFNPLWLVLAAMLPRFMTRRGSESTVRFLAIIQSVLAFCAIAMHLVGLSSQANWAIIALAAPPTVAMAWATTRSKSP